MRGLCRPDLKFAIDGNGIATDDLSLERFGEHQREGRLPAGGGAQDDYQQRQFQAALQKWRSTTKIRIRRATIARPSTCWRCPSITSNCNGLGYRERVTERCCSGLWQSP